MQALDLCRVNNCQSDSLESNQYQALRLNYKRFCQHLVRGYELVHERRFVEAAYRAEMAAACAAHDHCGLFASSELERLLGLIGSALPPPRDPDATPRQWPSDPAKVLHVFTYMSGVGGMESMLRRWVRHDAGRRHSLALTRQVRTAVTEDLKSDIERTGGTIYRLNAGPGGLLAWAHQLRCIARDQDMIVLHLWADDVVPVIAFADRTGLPPIMLIDHSDHTFWLGVSISDLVVALRRSGQRLAQQRRGVSAARSTLLPTILTPPSRNCTREEAKRRLGLPDNSVTILSIARSCKYKSVGGDSYLDIHLPILQQHENAVLVIVGPGDRPDWRHQLDLMPDRIIVRPQMQDVTLYQQAADIYVDSFPIVSITSLLEAGSFGTPLVSRQPFGPDSEVLLADAWGLDGTLLRATTSEQYASVLTKLIEDADYRRTLGTATADAITTAHALTAWTSQLGGVYAQCAANAADGSPRGIPDDVRQHALDRDLITIHSRGFDWSVESIRRLRAIPAGGRARQLVELIVSRHVTPAQVVRHIPYLLPEWLLVMLFRIYFDLVRQVAMRRTDMAKRETDDAGWPVDEEQVAPACRRHLELSRAAVLPDGDAARSPSVSYLGDRSERSPRQPPPANG